MADKSDSRTAEEVLQEMLAELQQKLNAVYEFAHENNLKFRLGELDYNPVDGCNEVDDSEVSVEEWHSSWSPGC